MAARPRWHHASTLTWRVQNVSGPVILGRSLDTPTAALPLVRCSENVFVRNVVEFLCTLIVFVVIEYPVSYIQHSIDIISGMH